MILWWRADLNDKKKYLIKQYILGYYMTVEAMASKCHKTSYKTSDEIFPKDRNSTELLNGNFKLLRTLFWLDWF